MNIIDDAEFIRDFLSQDDMVGGYGDIPDSDKELMRRKQYFMQDGIMFPANLMDDGVVLHIAAPKDKRGSLTVRASKKVIEYLIGRGNRVFTKIKKSRRLRFFVHMVGFKVLRFDEDSIYCEAKG